MFSKFSTLLLGMALLVSAGCHDRFELPEPSDLNQEVVATNLQLPIGLALDNRGRFWVTESGTGEQNARVSVILPSGQRYTAFAGFTSVVANGSIEGIGHVLYNAGKLYILDGGAGKLYTVDISSYQPGAPVRDASELSSEDIGTFVRAQQLTNPVNSNAYNLTIGPDGSLYIVDSGANAIIRRDKTTRALSVFARFPNVTPAAEAVPTGIVYDGRRFLVSTLSGFPFAPSVAKIFQVSRTGQVSDYRLGFTTLTDIALLPNGKPVVIEYGQFSLTPPAIGFQPRTGRVATEDGTTLADDINLPTDIERGGTRTYSLLSRGDGTITRLSY